MIKLITIIFIFTIFTKPLLAIHLDRSQINLYIDSKSKEIEAIHKVAKQNNIYIRNGIDLFLSSKELAQLFIVDFQTLSKLDLNNKTLLFAIGKDKNNDYKSIVYSNKIDCTYNRNSAKLLYKSFKESLKKIENRDSLKIYEIEKNYLKLKFNVDEKEIDNITLNESIKECVINIGVLAKRGKETTLNIWSSMAQYLTNSIEEHKFQIIPIEFDMIESNVKNESIDFLITNTMNYVELEYKYGISRIATLKKYDKYKNNMSHFGSVIFTLKDTPINTIDDLYDKKFGAVHRNSFGGWIMAKKELFESNFDEDDFKSIEFLETHDNVVYSVLNKQVDAGTVRSDTLESMSSSGLININDFKIINQQNANFRSFPFLLSTELYPEWPLAKLKHSSQKHSNMLLIALLEASSLNKHIINSPTIAGWTIPLDYTRVHTVLKELKISPYNNIEISFMDIYYKYKFWIYAILLLFGVIIYGFIYIKIKNRKIEHLNETLEHKVADRTKELTNANIKLKEIASKDFLTNINNRRAFFQILKQHFFQAKRESNSLQLLSLDIDFFKSVNDKYGHDTGDTVLKTFTKTTTKLLRKSDIFGRVGGEEFMIALPNTDIYGAKVLAEKIRETISKESIKIDKLNITISITVSIGIATIDTKKSSLDDALKEVDLALYKAKNLGRNRIEVYETA